MCTVNELDLETCCVGLDSNKITERKKSADTLRDLLKSSDIIQLINHNDNIGVRRNWDYVYNCVYKYVKKEGEKLQADEAKQKLSFATVSRVKNSSQEILILVITKANCPDPKLTVSKLIDTVLQCFNSDYLKQYFGDTFINILLKFVLSNRRYWGQIESQQWKKLYDCLKQLYINRLPDIQLQNIISGLYLTVKLGSVHSSFNVILRKEFDFVKSICNSLKTIKAKKGQEMGLKFLLSFSVQLSKDCRTATCKLGEEVISSILDLYEPRYEHFGGIKSLMFDYLLLQVRLHHPGGYWEDSHCAHAQNWTHWKSALHSIYSILCTEVDVIERLTSDKWKLWPNFLSLIVDVARQIFQTGVHDITHAAVLASDSDTSQQPLSKRPRLEIGITPSIYAIKSTGNKTWILILTELLKMYPDIIKPNEFAVLLECLADLQGECKDLLVRDYLYNLLSTMVKTQEEMPEEFLDLENINSIWSKIWDTSLRSVGLNQNVEATHNLLQTMLNVKGVSQQESSALLQIYASGVLNVSAASLQTLHVLCKTMIIPEYIPHRSDITTRTNLINWIVGLHNNKLLSSFVLKEKLTAEVLTGLVLKTSPYRNKMNVIDLESNREYTSIEELYKLSCFDGKFLVVPDSADAETIHHNTNNHYLIHCDSLKDLKNSLNIFISFLLDNTYNSYLDILDLVNGNILIINLLSELFTFNILDDRNLVGFINIEELLNKLCDIVLDYLKCKRDSYVLLEQIELLFSAQVCEPVSTMFRRKVPTAFLRMFFDLLDADNDDEEDDTNFSQDADSNDSSSCFLIETNLKDIQKVKLTSMHILSKYCCVPNADGFSQTQQHVLDKLSEPNFNPANMVEVQTTLCFIRALNSCKFGTLSGDTLDFMLKSLSNLLQYWHQDYHAAHLLIQILKDTLLHVSHVNVGFLKRNAEILLTGFFEKRDCYGPDVSIAVIQCFGILIKIDLFEQWATNKNLFGKILEYMKCDYREVRLEAIKTIANIFAAETGHSITAMDTQRVYIQEMYLKVMALLAANDDGVDEDGVDPDEVNNNMACVLHTHVAIIVASPTWRKKSLFALIQYISRKKLKTDFSHKIFKTIAKCLHIKDFQVYLNMNINYIILQWSKENESFNDFPFHLYECETSLSFFTKHVNLIIPILLQRNDTEALKNICHVMQKSLNEMIKDTFPAIMAQFLPPFILANASAEYDISNEDVCMSERLFKQLEELYSLDRIKDLISELSDDIFINLLHRFYDLDHFQQQFGFNKNFPEPDPPHVSHKILLFTLKHIEKNLLQKSNSESIVMYYANKCPNKLEHILLEMTIQLYKSLTFEEKLISLHRYSVFIDNITAEFNHVQNQISAFLIRSIVYTLMNIIKLNQNSDELLCVATCRYFKKFCSATLTKCAGMFQKYLTLITGTLVPVAKLDSALSEECVAILNFLIVENVRYLYTGIGQLDPFPSDAKFRKIEEVYEKIKYGNERFTLEQEIVHFLNAGKTRIVCDRTEGLQHLRTELCERKMELAQLYDQLRGFSEDRDKSILHQLICMLVKLTASTNNKVRLEAAKCLGELGPADLITLCLMSEQPLTEEELSPLQLVTGQIITLLTQYLVSEDISLVTTATKALYTVVATKEAKQLLDIESDIDFGYGTIEKSYLVPFIAKASQKKTSSSINIDENTFHDIVDNFDLWSPNFECSHSKWITLLVCKLLAIFPKTCYLQDLIPVCHVKVEFSEKLLPLLIYLILNQNKEDCSAVISAQIQMFFSKHWTSTISNKPLSSQTVNANTLIILNKVSVKCILDVIHFIRLRHSTEQDRNAMSALIVNYLHVANAAQFCSAYFTSILYSELWCYTKLDDYSPSALGSALSVFDYLRINEEPDTAQALENILREGYKKVGDIDAMYGCGTSYIMQTSSRVDYYKDMRQWDKVTLHYDLQLQYGADTSAHSELVHSLKKNSFHYLASQLDAKALETQYECAWRLSQWNIIENSDTENTITNNGFDKYHYFAMKLLHEGDYASLHEAVTEARKSVIQTLSHANLESSKNLYAALSQLQMIQEIENVCEAKHEFKLPELVEKWQLQNNLVKNEFEYIEPIKAQRLVILTDLLKNKNENVDIVKSIKSLVADLHLHLAAEARTEGFYHVAQRSLSSLSFIEDLASDIEGRILLEQAQLSWLDDKISGRYLLRRFLETHDQTQNPCLYASALKLYGNWMVETRSENASAIIEKYFEKSFQILSIPEQTPENTENICDVLDCLARFADSQYQQVTNYINSSVFEAKIQTIEKLKAMAKKFSRNSMTQDEKRAITLYEKQSTIDIKEVENVKNEKSRYLLLAVTQYIKILMLSDKYNLKIFRILSLCVANKTNKDLLAVLKTSLFKISSYKYIPLVPQLVPHISNNPDDVFESIVTKLIERCAVDHPHHTLPVIMAFADSYRDRIYDPDNKSENAEPRVQIAKDLVKRLSKKKQLSSIVRNMEFLSNALIRLAYLKLPKGAEKSKQIAIPRGEDIKTIKNFDNILLPTITLSVRKDCNYTDIVGIRQYDSSYSLVGGVNAPKKITCIGTDGIRRSQLVKGKDDLRQDAVMQQVFTILNTLLANNKQTNKLSIRTYKVVPLSQRSGIIEWCEDTEPIGNYLCDAHKRYHPSDLPPGECRSLIRKAGAASAAEKLRIFKEICAKFRPVFHMFFIASYPQATVWFERRRAYMHSVATSSMVGYILGLGDRHVTNILIDKTTAEVIHIDLGIAFEQGRTLPTPETVPFRLTRDIEAGMGVCGIEGVFRRCCEKTMYVLRQNAETVLSILEVLLYDPLYAWTITPAEAYSRQRDDEDSISFSDEKDARTDAASVNVTAERVLSRLKQKLQGTEDGGVYSVEGQVELLLQQARDMENLSRLYNGWQAYL